MMVTTELRFLSCVLALTAGAVCQDGQSTFGHARARELAELGRLPAARDIVARDILNYHRHRLPLPAADRAVALDLRFDRSHAAAGDEFWLQVGYATRSEGDRALAAPCAIALVVDCSGSMQERGKMSQVHRGLAAFVERLRDDDRIAVVGFATEARLITRLRPRGDGAWLQDTIAALQADGNTNLHAGLMLGLEQLSEADLGAWSRRVVLLTDGIANTGVTEPAAIAADVRRHRGDSIDVSTIGVGQDLDTALLQQLADQNAGLFHFVADERDVQKVFVSEIDSLLSPAARNVRLSLDLPDGLEVIASYGETVTQSAQRTEVRLPDLNAGATGVMMLRCRMHARAVEAHDVRATLTFDDAARVGPPSTITASAEVPTAGSTTSRTTTDVEVRKHAAIAVLADGLAAMARACDARLWADAARELRVAEERAAALFPGDDADVERVHEIVRGHARTLQRYVDRFRDS